MRTTDLYAHSRLLKRRLLEYLKEGTFARRMSRKIGDAIDNIFEEERAHEDDGFSALFPVEALFLWISKNGGYDPRWLQDDHGEYIDDSDQRVEETVRPVLSGAEQLAAYGLWLVEDDMPSIGDPEDDGWDESDFNPNGFSQLEAINHRAECLLLAYQALQYAERMTHGAALTPAEAEQAIGVVDFAEMAERALNSATLQCAR